MLATDRRPLGGWQYGVAELHSFEILEVDTQSRVALIGVTVVVIAHRHVIEYSSERLILS
jgi:hypothetical protein